MNTSEINRIPKKKSIIVQVLKLFEFIFIIIAILFSLVIVMQRINDNTSFFGYRIYRVETGSMVPIYNVGDVILAREKSFSEINVDDDVVYISESKETYGYTITHRIIQKNEDDHTIITKGIANDVADPTVSEEQILGVVIYKLRLVTLICKLLNNYVFVYFFVVVPGTIYFFFVWLHSKNLKER
jgi:signal peptidase